MELECRIHLVMPAMSGVSQRTGNKWMSQEYVLAYHWWPNQTDPSFIVMRVFGEDKIKHFNLQPNDEVKVRFHCEAHESNGRWYNELRIDGVTFVGASAGKNQTMQQAGQQTGQQAAADAAGTVAQAGENQAQAGQQAQAAVLTDDQKKAMEKLNQMGGNGSDMPF
jgi:hypothetical protein